MNKLDKYRDIRYKTNKKLFEKELKERRFTKDKYYQYPGQTEQQLINAKTELYDKLDNEYKQEFIKILMNDDNISKEECDKKWKEIEKEIDEENKINEIKEKTEEMISMFPNTLYPSWGLYQHIHFY